MGLGTPAASSTLTVTITAPPATGHITLLNGANVYQCNFVLTATLVGGLARERVFWEYGTISLRRNSDGQQATLNVLGTDYVTMFGSTDFVKGEQAKISTYPLYWSGPFTGTLVTFYNAGGAPVGTSLDVDKSVSTPLVCN